MGKRNVGINVVTALLVSILACGLAWGQGTGQISGTVRDQSGAVLPGVEITVTQTSTGLVRNAITNETGAYTLPNLPIGPYRLEASLPGFRTYAQSGIVLQVGSNLEVTAVLEVGQVAETVEVQADAAMVETRSTGVGQVIDNTRVLEMPLNGRQVTELILLSGAAVAGGAQPSIRNYPTESISVGGGMNNGLTYQLDGGTHNDPFNNLNLPMPFPDALQEFKVETSSVPAQYGHHSSGAVNAVTKSGTNAFHGSLFEFVRNKVFNARNAFEVTRDGLKRNQFGGTFGGPVVQNKLFFFGAYQGTIRRSEPTGARAFIPTPAMLAGDWTAITSAACVSGGRQLTLRAPFVNNRIDPSQFSIPALNLVKRLPTTNDPCGEVRFGRRSNSHEDIVVGKVDLQRSERHSLFGRYQFARLTTPNDYDGVNLLSFSNPNDKAAVQSFVLGDTYLFGTSTVSSFRGTLNRTKVDKQNPQDFFSWSDLGVADVFSFPNYAKYIRLAVTGGFEVSSSRTTPGATNSTIFQFVEDISMVKGAHQIGYGANFINSRMNVAASTSTAGVMSFSTTNTGLGLGDFMVGRPSNWVQQNINSYHFRQNYIGLYLQDTWKTSDRLTINAGLRWEPFLPARDKHNRVLHFDQAAFEKGVRSTVYRKAPAGLFFQGDPNAPDNANVMPTHLMHFAPRFGLAWNPTGAGTMTVRAAYGVFFDLPHFYQFNSMRDSPPWGYRVAIPNPAGGFADPWREIGGNPFPAPLSPDIAFPLAGSFVYTPENLKSPYVNQWNVSLQKQFGSDWLVSASYLGNLVVHLLDSVEANPAIFLPGASCVINGRTFTPCSSTGNTTQRRLLTLINPTEGQYYGNIVQADDGGTRSYNAMLLSVQRRRAKGVTVQGNYTWSHCIDDGTSTQFQNNGGQVPGRRGENRGNCAQDIRHNVNVSTVYETPQFSSTAMRILASGWRISGIVRLQSGVFLTVDNGTDRSLTGTTDQRPNMVLSDPYAPNKSTSLWLNAAAFALPELGTYGNLGCCNIQAPGSVRIDMGLTRTFQIRENHSLEFRAEAFNVPNHLNPGLPTVALNDQNFGKILTATDPRIIQLALKYVF